MLDRHEAERLEDAARDLVAPRDPAEDVEEDRPDLRIGRDDLERIDHALRVTVERTRAAYVYPARHEASDDDDPALPRMGERLRLKASVDVSGLPRQARAVARAMKRYGLIVADNGSDWFVSGAPSRHWDDDGLHALGELTGRAFEVVDVPR
jgi:hypothetical protein